MTRFDYSITYNGKNSWEMRTPVKWRPSIPAPELEQDLITIPGRDGALTSSIKRYEPLEFEVEMNFLDKPNRWAEVFRECKKWLRGSGTLEQSDDKEYYFKVLKAEITDTERTSQRLGNFTAKFICDPYMYRKDGRNAYGIETVKNNLYETCHPVYCISGTGTATLTVNGNSMTVAVTGKAYIDTDLMIAYDGNNASINTAVTGDYSDFYLQPGENEISISSGFNLTIVPNWRSL